jgi:DNA-directed RNA polymerase specialized sigma24 family protein
LPLLPVTIAPAIALRLALPNAIINPVIPWIYFRDSSTMRSSAGSVTHCLDQVKDGDPAAIQQIWERYFARMVGLVRGKLRTTPRLAAYEEDVALSAFDSFFRAVKHGRFPKLHDRDDVWQILVILAIRKVYKLIRGERRKKRGGDKVLNAGDWLGMDAQEADTLLGVISREPTPQEAVEVAEECERLLDQLQDPKLCQIALWKLEGYTNEAIARRLGCVLRTVERKLQAIRDIWEKENRT